MPEPSGITVLVVDDQPLAREGNTLVLDFAPGIRVIGEAADGHEAIQQATRLEPDIVLMDVRMPGVDGIRATGARDGQHAHQPHLRQARPPRPHPSRHPRPQARTAYRRRRESVR